MLNSASDNSIAQYLKDRTVGPCGVYTQTKPIDSSIKEREGWGGDWPQGKDDKKLGPNREDPRPCPCCLPPQPGAGGRSLGGRKDQPLPTARPCSRAQTGKGGGAVVQFITNQVYWKNPSYTDIVCPPPPPRAQLASGGNRQAVPQHAWGLGHRAWQRGGSPPWLSPLASLCSLAPISSFA